MVAPSLKVIRQRRRHRVMTKWIQLANDNNGQRQRKIKEKTTTNEREQEKNPS